MEQDEVMWLMIPMAVQKVSLKSPTAGGAVKVDVDWTKAGGPSFWVSTNPITLTTFKLMHQAIGK